MPETETLFVGIGDSVLSFLLSPVKLVEAPKVEMGFWSWRRYEDVIVMPAELEIALWNLEGQKIWSTSVEPPWSYHIENNLLIVDIMGVTQKLDLDTLK